ncbi:facilitated trehalose transporter Tret1-like isoform X2 [Coccinella septempunctata]|nr:facilitated trehalose transporter Tret1-like isoform X2 [Coccinella septempunctata]
MEDNPLGRPLTPEESDLIGSIYFIGASIGPLLCIFSVERFGRKKMLALLSAITPISYIILTFAENVELYYLARVLLGLYAGAALSIEPVYVSEIAGPQEREFLMSCVSVFNFGGILASYAVGPFIPLFYFNSLIAVFSLTFVILLALGCPESPYYVMQTKGKDETRVLLKKLRRGDVEGELQAIEKTVGNQSRSSYFEIFKSTKNFKPFVLATIPLVLQQYCGITLIVTYSQLIFLQTEISIPSHICSIIVVCLQISTSFLTPTLLKSQKFTQKSLLYLCFTGLGLCNLVLGFFFLYGKDVASLNFLPLVGLIVFVVFYNCGIDPIPWITLGQVYPMNINTVGTALSTSIFFISIFPVLYMFYKVDLSYLFLSSAFSCLLGLLYAKFIFTENFHKKEESA